MKTLMGKTSTSNCSSTYSLPSSSVSHSCHTEFCFVCGEVMLCTFYDPDPEKQLYECQECGVVETMKEINIREKSN